MKSRFYYIVLLLAFVLLISCSTKRNTGVSRFYHAFTSNYNIYYNGKTSFDEAFSAMQAAHKDNYSEIIHLYPVSALPKEKEGTGGPFDRAIEKGEKAIKRHSIRTKPLKKPGWHNNPKAVARQKQEEYNPFLKKCWLLIGQSQFYNADFLQASATFSYIARHYSGNREMVAEAKIWQARCYSEMGRFYESEDILERLSENEIPPKKLNLYAAVYADCLVKNGRYEDAIPYLRTIIKAEKNKHRRTRMKYLLGQLYAALGLSGLACNTFGDVVCSNPPYELEIAARARQAEVYSDTNLVEKYPDVDVHEPTGEMLKGVLHGREIVQGGLERMIWNPRFGMEASSRFTADSARVFSADLNVPYRIIFAYPTKQLNDNQLLFTVAAYNFANFMAKDFDLSVEESGLTRMLIIREFADLKEAVLYYRKVYDKEGYANALSGEVAVLPVSEDNYEALVRGKTLEEYVTFFIDSLGHQLPELRERWELRLGEKGREEGSDSMIVIPGMAANQIRSDTTAVLSEVRETMLFESSDKALALKNIAENRQAKLKVQKQLRKEKERAHKGRLRQKEKERKAKKKAYKKQLKEEERAGKAFRKTK